MYRKMIILVGLIALIWGQTMGTDHGFSNALFI